MGPIVNALSVIPAAIAGWLLGVRGGFAAGLLLVILTYLLHAHVHESMPSGLPRTIPGQVVTVGIGVLAGWARNAVLRLRR